MKNKSYVNASEIGQYVYCRRTWWIQFMGLDKVSEHMIRGTLGHELLNNDQIHYSRRKHLYFTVALTGLILIALIIIDMLW